MTRRFLRPLQAPALPVFQKGSLMPRNQRTFAAAVLALLAAVPLLGACHTTAGAGQDISATGRTIEHAADKATP